MSKKKERITGFLKGYRPESETDEREIGWFLLKRIGKVYHRKDKPNYDSLPTLNFEQFTQWYKSDIPPRGTVVVWDDGSKIGVVIAETWDNFVLGATLDSGMLSVEDSFFDGSEWQVATQEQESVLQKSLAASGYAWNIPHSTIVKRDVPDSPRYIRLSIMGHYYGIGIFREITIDGKLSMFCLKVGEGKVRFQEELLFDDPLCFSFSITYPCHRAEINQGLSDEGFIWNHKLQRIEPKHFRRKKGEQYYFLDTAWNVLPATESGSNLDNERFKANNYHLHKKDAAESRCFMINFRKNQIIGLVECEGVDY